MLAHCLQAARHVRSPAVCPSAWGRTAWLSSHSTQPLLFSIASEFNNHAITSRWYEARRGAKRRATAQIQDLPQGVLPAPFPDAPPVEIKEYPTVIQQALNNMRKFSQGIVLTRVGGFYELYFEQATKYGPMLNIKVAEKKTSKGPVKMAGFPVYQLQRYLKHLVQDLKLHVAISNEVAIDLPKRVKSGGLMWDRKVERVVTPGTLIDEQFMEAGQSHYLLSVHVDRQTEDSTSGNISDHSAKPVGLAWLDLASGEFTTQATTIGVLPSAIARIGPKEIIFDRRFQTGELSDIPKSVERDGLALAFQDCPTDTSVADWAPMLEDAAGRLDAAKFSPIEVAAGGSLLHYVQEQLQGQHTRLQTPTSHTSSEYMMIDKATFRALEIRSTLRDGLETGSLFHALKRTVTAGGTRLLANRLAEPSASLDVINARLDLVAYLKGARSLRTALVEQLEKTYDTPRLVSKFTLGRGDADDLVFLAKTIEVMSEIAAIVQKSAAVASADDKQSSASRPLHDLVQKLTLEEPAKLARRISKSIDEEGLFLQHELEQEQVKQMAGLAQSVLESEAGSDEVKTFPKRLQPRATPRTISSSAISGSSTDPFIMRPEANHRLNKLHKQLEGFSTRLEELRNHYRETLDAGSLDLKWTPSHGHIVHVKRKDVAKVAGLESAYSVSSSLSTGSFKIPEWTDLGGDLDTIRLRIREEERAILNTLRTEVVQNLVVLRRNSEVLAELDVACGFATIAQEKGLTRPILNTGTGHYVIGGAHLVVEAGLLDQGRSFTSNDCLVGSPAKIWLITGPNMGGKSTFLRQNAQISILAQTGSFVPADYAEIGIVDKIFTRVGSSDNLYQDQSTFMVEMCETAEILRGATPRSFVVMDEVGRGTTPEDGIAVGYACLDHLRRVNQCRTIFATHFHALADMTQTWDDRACYCSDVVEDDEGKFSYVHRLREGVSRESHALKVARMAGLPEEAILTAQRVLNDLKVTTTPTAALPASEEDQHSSRLQATG